MALGRTRSKWTLERPAGRGGDGLAWDGSSGKNNPWIHALLLQHNLLPWLPSLLPRSFPLHCIGTISNDDGGPLSAIPQPLLMPPLLIWLQHCDHVIIIPRPSLAIPGATITSVSFSYGSGTLLNTEVDGHIPPSLPTCGNVLSPCSR